MHLTDKNPKIEQDPSLREESGHILNQLLDRVALIGLTLGGLAAIGSVSRAFTQGWHANVLVDIIFYIILMILLIIRKKLPISVTAALLFIFAAINAYISFINLGLATMSFVILAAICTLTGIFFGFRIGFISLVLSFLIISGVGLMITTGKIRTISHVETYLLSPQTWITQLSGFLVYALILLAVVRSIQLRLWQSIIELKKKSDALHESEAHYRLLAENMHDMMCIVDMSLNIKYVSPSAEKLFGYSVAEILQMRLDQFLTPVSMKNALESYSKKTEMAMKGVLDSSLLEYEFLRKDGSTFWGEWQGAFLFEDGRITGSQGVIRDVTGRKKAEDQIRRDLEEKKTLLQEIHHRVKNNLNVVTSLLSLQANKMENNPAVFKAFRESRDRIRTMALVHEKLYQSDNLEKIDIKSYIETMVRELFHAYCGRNDVALDIDVQAVALDINTAIPCGLILNELISNAMKYAFPADRSGRIRIQFNPSDDRHYTLTVSDDGIGLPEELSLSDSLGLHLVHLLAEQLEGSVQIDRRGGTRFSIHFPSK